MQIAIIELVSDDNDEEDAVTKAWTKRLDRGGLWHINNSVFSFLAMELESKCLLAMKECYTEFEEDFIECYKEFPRSSIKMVTSYSRYRRYGCKFDLL